MNLTIKIDLDNAAFEDNSYYSELRPIFQKICETICDTGEGLPCSDSIRDSNGNTVGTWRVGK